MSEYEVDDYWVKMGAAAFDSMSGFLRPDMGDMEKEVLVQYLGEILDNAYEMGVRLGGLRDRLERIKIQRKFSKNEE